jgi:hypothetical protein
MNTVVKGWEDTSTKPWRIKVNGTPQFERKFYVLRCD